MTLSHCAKPRWKSPHWKPPHLWLLYHMSIKTGCLDFSKWLLKCCSNRSRDCTFITEKPSSQQPTNERTPGNKPVTIWLETSLKRNVLLQGAQGFDCTTAARTWVQSREDLDSCSCHHPRSLTHTQHKLGMACQLWVTHSITCVKAINVFVVWEWQPDKLARCARIYILSFLIYLMTFWFKLKWLKTTGVLRFAKCYCHCYYANNANANMLVLSKIFFVC